MSMSYYSDQGWGYKITDERCNAEGIKRCIMKSKETYEDVLAWCNEHNKKFEELDSDDLREAAEYLCDSYTTEFGLVAKAMNEETGISFSAIKNFDSCEEYIIYPVAFPWWLNTKEKALKKEELEEIMTEWYRVLVGDEDETPDFNFIDCVNWG